MDMLETKPQKTKKHRALIIKTGICAALVISAVAIKYSGGNEPVPAWSAVSNAVTQGVDYRKAAAQIGRAIQGEGDVLAVFGSVAQDVLFGEQETETKAPVAEAEATGAIHAADLSIELLSFEMSEEERLDDTPSEPVIPKDKKEQVAGFRYTTPLHGRVTCPFGYRIHPILKTRSFHTGIDIGSPSGTPIVAFSDGVVLDAGNNNIYGNYVLLGHGAVYRTFYGHCSKLLVKTGDTVKLGQEIAKVGTTGLSTGPHLHFEVRKGKTRLDPAGLINFSAS